ncbi:MAG TPA: class F sortase, partial [Roseiflexaceae bacterium]|nr:class F sortase [Roseiflexaceae bacterium]
MQRWFRRRSTCQFALALLLVLASARVARAQFDQSCFRETGYCTSGRIREFWDQNGGLMAFGYPITPQQQELVEGRPTLVQWFERNRLELHPENAPPYDVLIGRIGADRLQAQGRDWKRFPRVASGADCRFFPETGQSACGDFLAAWLSSGLNFDGDPAISDVESLGLFGVPLSGVRAERQPDGQIVMVQWFERARFERHPENAPPYNVLLGLLGRESSPVAAAPPIEPALVIGGGAAPTRLTIDEVGIDQPIVSVGVDPNGEPVVPDHEVGWWDASAAPGRGENVVLWAHVLRFMYAPDIPAPFERLKEVSIGSAVTVYDDQGQPHPYAVTDRIEVTPDQVEYLLPKGREIVTMVSCYGDSVIVDGAVVDM